MNILMLCYYFPPITDVGSKRSVAFSEYFKKNGWNPFVISVQNPDKFYCSVGNEAPPDGIHTEYTFSLFNPYKLLGRLNGVLARLLKIFNTSLSSNYFYDVLCIPDHFIGWIPLTLIKSLIRMREHRIDVIYISCSPFSSAITGTILKFLTGKPLIVDFRDPYALKGIPFLAIPKFRQQIDRFIEKMIIKYSDVFVVTTEETRRCYSEQYPCYQEKIHTVHNGFDTKYLVTSRGDKFARFTVIYTGQFYFYDERCAMHTEAFFKALARLKSINAISSENFQFLYFGDGTVDIERIAGEHDVHDLVACSAGRPYREILDILAKAHLQLLRIVKPMISTKLFEGIPLNVPFLATIPQGEVEEIIRTYSPGSYIVTNGSADEVAKAILDAISTYRLRQIKDNHIQDFLQNYSRDSLTLKLMDIIIKNTEIQSTATSH